MYAGIYVTLLAFYYSHSVLIKTLFAEYEQTIRSTIQYELNTNIRYNSIRNLAQSDKS